MENWTSRIQPPSIVHKIYPAIPENIIVIHEITRKQLNELSLKSIIKRFTRAIKERSIQVLMLHTLPQQTPSPFEDNFSYLMSIKESLGKQGINIGNSALALNELSLMKSGTINSRKAMAFIIALFVPTLSVLFIIKRINYVNYKISLAKVLFFFMFVSLFSIGSGLWISWLLYNKLFILKIDQFQGTKFALIGPLCILTAYLVIKELSTIKRIFDSPVTVSTVIFVSSGVCCVFMMLALVLIRSGNTFFSTLPGEKYIRETMENILIARPRFKELIGHPLFMSGVMFIGIKRDFFRILGFCLITAGTIGQTSIVNTFCHAHTPLLISIIRTLLGLFIGGLFGVILIKSINSLYNK